MNKNKHLLSDEIIRIEELLKEGRSFKAIANELGKSPTTVSREIRSHTIYFCMVRKLYVDFFILLRYIIKKGSSFLPLVYFVFLSGVLASFFISTKSYKYNFPSCVLFTTSLPM